MPVRRTYPSRYFQLLKSSGPIVSYPYGDGPITEAKAIAMLEGGLTSVGRVDAAFKPLKVRTYTPIEVRELLKLLAEGDLSEEQLDAYAEDDGRLRTYAALAKQRALTIDEQAAVDEIGRRLDAEAASLVSEDLGYERERRNEIEGLTQSYDEVENKKLTSFKEAAQRKYTRAEAKEAQLRGDAELLALEEEEANGWPSAFLDMNAALADQVRLQQLRGELSAISAKKVRTAIVRDDTESARKHLRRNVPELQATEAALQLANMTKRRVNPRFGRPSPQEMPQLVDAIEVSRLPDAAEDKTGDYDFMVANTPGGPSDQFYKYNAISHGLFGDPKFISNADIHDEWTRFVQIADPGLKLPKKEPWSGTNRKQKLTDMISSAKVPSAFKMQILRKTGFV